MHDTNTSTPPTARARKRLAFLRPAVLVGAAILLAACSYDEPASSDSPGDAAASGVATRDHPQLGKILTDSQGDTLYFADQEADGQIHCLSGCLKLWTPMEMKEGAPAPAGIADLGVIQRSDNGQKQLTYQGKPVYTFTLDSGAGDTKGHNAEDDFDGTHFVWHAVVLGGAQPPGDGGGQPTTTDDGGYGY
jgi:predicted lipoprotein with Yx(FWY)xxD motif